MYNRQQLEPNTPPSAPRRCPFCGRDFPGNKLKQHKIGCPQAPVVCETCGITCTKENVHKHSCLQREAEYSQNTPSSADALESEFEFSNDQSISPGNDPEAEKCLREILNWGREQVGSWIRKEFQEDSVATKFIQYRIDGKSLLELEPGDMDAAFSSEEIEVVHDILSEINGLKLSGGRFLGYSEHIEDSIDEYGQSGFHDAGST
mmetsp:Transcript_33094/g.43570  ORF Transcript_33094/g.43570 Transcript_33094/m.43570 type:complete len:205 (+) Transcript_33094:17-631(+)